MIVMIGLTVSVYSGLAVYILNKINSSPARKFKGRNKTTASMEH